MQPHERAVHPSRPVTYMPLVIVPYIHIISDAGVELRSESQSEDEMILNLQGTALKWLELLAEPLLYSKLRRQRRYYTYSIDTCIYYSSECLAEGAINPIILDIKNRSRGSRQGTD